MPVSGDANPLITFPVDLNIQFRYQAVNITNTNKEIAHGTDTVDY